MSTTAPLSLGIDIGGTFTDLVIHDPRDGRAVIWKESTTPDDPARGAIEGTRKVLAKAGTTPDQVGRVVHATTLFQAFHAMVTTPMDRDVDDAAVGKLAVLAGVREFPARVKCASLAWHTLKAALTQAQEPAKTE